MGRKLPGEIEIVIASKREALALSMHRIITACPKNQWKSVFRTFSLNELKIMFRMSLNDLNPIDCSSLGHSLEAFIQKMEEENAKSKKKEGSR
jgi:hypothetical protein